MDDGGDWNDNFDHDNHDLGDHHHDDGAHFETLHDDGKISDKLHGHLIDWFHIEDEAGYDGVDNDNISSPKQSANQRFHNKFITPESVKALVIRHKTPENLHKAIIEDEIIKSLVAFAKKEANGSDKAFRKTLSDSLKSMGCSEEIAGVVVNHLHHVDIGTYEAHLSELFAKHSIKPLEEIAETSPKIGKFAIIGGSVGFLGAIGYWLFKQKQKSDEPKEVTR